MLSQAAGTLVPLLVTFITVPIIIELLGEEGYGLQNLAGVISGFLGFLNMGLDVPIGKFVAQYNALKNRKGIAQLLDTTAMMYLLIGTVGLLVAIVFSQTVAEHVFHLSTQFSPTVRTVFIISGIGFCISLVQGWGNACLIGLERYGRVNMINIPMAIFSPLAGILAIHTGFGITGFVAARVVVMAIGSAVVVIYAFNLLPEYRIHPKIHWETLKKISGYLGTGITLRLMGFIAGGLDRTLIGMWVSVSSVTVYAVQWSLISPIQSLLGNTFNYLFPLSSSLQATGERERFKGIFFKSGKLYAAMTCIAYGALFLFGTHFLSLWVGDKIAAQVSVVFPLLIISAMITQLCSYLLNATVVGSGRLRLYFGFTFTKAVLLACALLLFVRYFSLAGAGWAYLIAGMAEVVYLIVAIRSILQIPFKQFLWEVYTKPVVLTMVLCVAFWPMRDIANTWLLLAVSCTLFVTILGSGFILLRIIDPKDIVWLWQSSKSIFLRFSLIFHGMNSQPNNKKI